MDVGMDENWAIIAIEQLGLPILGVLGNFFFNLGIWTDLTWRRVTDRRSISNPPEWVPPVVE